MDDERVARALDDLVRSLGLTGASDERARLAELLRVPGLGKKAVRALWQQGVTNLGELLYACEENRVAHLPGFNAKKQARTLATVRARLESRGAILLAAALEATALVRAALGVEVEAVGEARRGHAVVRDFTMHARGDVAAIEKRLRAAAPSMQAGVVRAGGDLVLAFASGERARVRAIADAKWIGALLRATGSDAHLRWLEARAGGRLDAICAKAKREEDVYEAIGLPFAPPELREGPTPSIAPLVDRVRGVFHVHTDWSDGTATIVDMAREAARAGLAYIGITDHTKAASYANGLDAARLREQAKAIAIARREIPEIAILHGTEVDILADGALDLDDDVLAALDFVIASVHVGFAMSVEAMTARVVRAVSHPLVTILGHPTGRLLLGRGGCTFDIDAVARAAAANDTYLEINANPQRLDLSDDLARRAAAHGAAFAIDPDAHTPRGISDAALGVTVARRAGLASSQILNARERDDLVATLAERKRRALARVSAARPCTPR